MALAKLVFINPSSTKTLSNLEYKKPEFLIRPVQLHSAKEPMKISPLQLFPQLKLWNELSILMYEIAILDSGLYSTKLITDEVEY